MIINHLRVLSPKRAQNSIYGSFLYNLVKAFIGSGEELCVSHTSLLPPIHLGAARGTFSVLAARKMPPGAEMPAASTQKPHCGPSKWIGGKTVPAWARSAPLMGEVGLLFGRGWFLCGQPRPKHMPCSTLRWHFSGRGWLHINHPRPLQVPLGTQYVHFEAKTRLVSIVGYST